VSTTAPRGFRCAGVAGGLTRSGGPDVALIVNDGPDDVAAAVFTTNRFPDAPVLWSRQVISGGRVKAVFNSGRANACTGREGFRDTHDTAEHVAAELGIGAIYVAVASTGLIGVRLPMDDLTAGVTAAVEALSTDGDLDAARAIMTTDSVPRTTVQQRDGCVGRRRGATKEIAITVRNAASVEDALAAGRACAPSNLFETALFGNDPKLGPRSPRSAPPTPPSSPTRPT
jgi:glutamate N-acetyltransferase/amino-acid N-acetyltransferase